MKPFLLSLLLVLAAVPARADEDGGEPVTFGGKSIANLTIALPARAGRDVALWDSGPSDPMKADFEGVLFHGVLADSGIVFQGALKEGDGWTEWTDAAIERFPNGRFWGRIPVSGAKGAIVRVRMLHRNHKGKHAVVLYAMELEQREQNQEPPAKQPSVPYEGPRSTPTARPAVAPRTGDGGWGAQPASKPYEPMVPVRVSVHHTEASQPMNDEDARTELKVIQNFHMKGRGWIDIAYHFLIDGQGHIWQGRPENVIGSHVRNHNDGNVGIALMGSFGPPQNMQPTPAQLTALVELSKYLVTNYEIDPGLILGHKDQLEPGYTSCPGDILYAKLPDIRRQVEEATQTTTLVRLKTAERLNQIIDGNILRSLIGTDPDLSKLNDLDKVFNKNRGR